MSFRTKGHTFLYEFFTDDIESLPKPMRNQMLDPELPLNSAHVVTLLEAALKIKDLYDDGTFDGNHPFD